MLETVDNHYSWDEMRGTSVYRAPAKGNLGGWAVFAVVASLVLHAIVLIGMNQASIGLRFQQARDLYTAPVDIRELVIVSPAAEDISAAEETIIPPESATQMLEEIDLLAMLPEDQEIEVLPDQLAAQYALQLGQVPALDGDPLASEIDALAGFDVDAALPDLGRTEDYLPPSAVGQLTIDPGAIHAEELDLSQFTQEIQRQGLEGGLEQGALDGIATLDELIGLPENILVGRKTMLPSDLLFEFNKAELRESARIGLMKLALLIDRNPKLYCWIEGHTDLIGSDGYNLQLAKQRAEAVKRYLVDSLRMDPEQIITRGFGKRRPLVTTGSADEQAPNRRVEIRMRKDLPPDDEPIAAPLAPPAEMPVEVPDEMPVAPPAEPTLRAVPVEEEMVAPEPAPPKAILVKPNREFSPEEIEGEQPPMRALPVEPEAEPPAESAPQRALPVEKDEPLRAVPVDDE